MIVKGDASILHEMHKNCHSKIAQHLFTTWIVLYLLILTKNQNYLRTVRDFDLS